MLRTASQRVKRAAILIDQTLVAATPVDTGRARSNWIVTLGVPSAASRLPMSPTEALREGESVINGWRPGQSIFITNNLNYISKLNAGSSAQAPAGFVERAVERGRRSLGQK